MKINRKALVYILIISIISSNMGIVFSASNKDLNLIINNEKIDVDIISQNGRTLLPMRKVFEMLGARVDWNQSKKEVTGTKGDIEVKLVIGSNIAKINGEEFILDVPAQIIGSLTYVPVRFVGEALNNKVDWDHNTRTVLIDSDRTLIKDILKESKSQSKGLSEEKVYNSIIALAEKYPNGTKWDNSDRYDWKGGIWGYGYGCAGFAFMLSDAAFGNLPARQITDLKNYDLKVGDIIRVNGDSHSVIVIEINGDDVVIAEGNVMGMVLWGRTGSLKEIKEYSDYVVTRYPM